MSFLGQHGGDVPVILNRVGHGLLEGGHNNRLRHCIAHCQANVHGGVPGQCDDLVLNRDLLVLGEERNVIADVVFPVAMSIIIVISFAMTIATIACFDQGGIGGGGRDGR